MLELLKEIILFSKIFLFNFSNIKSSGQETFFYKSDLTSAPFPSGKGAEGVRL